MVMVFALIVGPATSKVKTLHQCRCTSQRQHCMSALSHMSASSMCALTCAAGSGSCTCTDAESLARFDGPTKPATKRVIGLQHGGDFGGGLADGE